MCAIPPKIYVLRFVGEQGIVSVDDVTRHLFHPGKLRAVRIAMHKLGVSHIKYSGIKHGVWFIDKPKLFELLNFYFPELPLFEYRTIPSVQFPHYLEINRIRTTLQKSTQITVDEWWSENYLRCLDPYTRMKFCPSQTPDAVFWVRRRDGSRQQFFLEFERTTKAKDRYEDIFISYANHHDVGKRNVLYICQTTHTREVLLSIEARMVKAGKLKEAGLYFQFVTLASFYKTYNSEQSINEEVGDENLQYAQVSGV